MIDTLSKAEIAATVLVLQTDGGPDHSLKRVATKFALVVMAQRLDVDRLIVLRCASNGSAMNKVERGMSVLNLPLAHAAIKRGDMSQWAVEQVKNANCMASVCTIAKKAKDNPETAAVEVGKQTKVVNTIEVIERLGVFLRMRMQTAQPELEEAGISLVVSPVSVIIQRQLGIANPSYNDSARGWGAWTLRRVR